MPFLASAALIDCRATMDSPTHNTTHHNSKISLQREGSADVMSSSGEKPSVAAVPLSAVEPSAKDFSVPNSVSEDPKKFRPYWATYVTVSSDGEPVTSSLMPGVSSLDSKDITTSDRSTKDRSQVSLTSAKSSSTSKATQCPSPTTTAPMIQTTKSAVTNMPQHQQQQDTAEECRDESSIRHVLSFSQCDQSGAATPNSDASSSDSESSATKRPRLTLSAFRRPEQTVRMTQSDPSRSLSEEYDLHSSECRILGHGASSTVRLAIRRRDGAKVAVKRIAKHDALRRRRVRRGNRRHLDEWEILQSLAGSPGIVSLLDVFETDEEVQLVMEYCQGGELFDAIKNRRGRYSEAQAACIISQMLSALCHLHSRGFVHRDVKPENILLTNEDDANVRVKLSDFGLARMLMNQDDSDSSSSDGEASPYTPLSRSRAYSCVGTDYYAAPEVCSGGGYDTAVDVYSLGVTLYVLLCGLPPSYTSDLSSVNEESDSDDDLCSVVFPTTHWKDVSASAKALIRNMLHPDPARRISAQEALENEWIIQNADSRDTHAPCETTSSRSVLDLELVRNRLYKKINRLAADELSRKRPFSVKARSKKRRRVVETRSSPKNSSSSLMAAVAMADLYRGVASAAASASAAAAGVVYDEYKEEVKIVDDDHVVDNVEKDDALVDFPVMGVTSPCARLTV